MSGAYFFGGLLLLLGGVGEFLLGNTFPTVVFTTFGESSLVATHSRNLAYAAINNCYSWYTDSYCKGSFWFAFGATLVPSYGTYATYAKDPVRTPQEGLTEPSICCIIHLLPLLYGTIVLHLPYCLHPHKSSVLLHIPASCARLRLPRGSILAHFIQHCS